MTTMSYKRYSPESRVTHTPEQDNWWQESAFTGWLDPISGIGGAFRLGLEPNHDGTGRVTLWAGVTTPDHAIYQRSDRLPYRPESRGERRWAAVGVASFAYDDHDDRLAHWQLRDDGVTLDLTIQDLHTPVALFPSAGWSLKERQARDHLECGVAVRGTVTLAGRQYVVDGGGYRDHSWGVRHWATLTAHRWLTGTLDDGRSFCVCAFSGIDGSRFHAGMVIDHRTDSVIYSDDNDILVFVEADGCSHRGGVATMRLPDGTMLDFEFEPFAKAPMAWHETVACVDSPCRIRCGDATGVGILEISTNPQQGTTKPMNVLTATVENGLHTDPARVAMPQSIRGRYGMAPFNRPML